jgi:hypothetical protein
MRPWSSFLLFTLAFALMAYGPFPALWKGLFGTALLLGPLVWSRKGNARPFQAPADFWPFPSGWILGWLALAAFSLRFYKLTTFSIWPTGDESLQGYLAIDLLRDWTWRFFYTSGQHPPLLIWCLAFFFKIFNGAFFNLWFLPALLSFLAWGAGYFTARLYFPATPSFLFSLLMAFGFWPLAFGRYCVQGVWIPFFEMGAFYLFGVLINEKSRPARKWRAAFLGLWLGVGTWTFTAWFSVVLVVGLFAWARFPRDKSLLGWGLVFFGFGFFPWIWAFFSEGFGGYLFSVSQAGASFSFFQKLINPLSYVTCLWMGPIQGSAGYGPIWGGAFNPLVAAAALVGALELARKPKASWGRAFVFGFFIFLAPGLLSADHVEMFRIIPVMPLILMVAALGLQRLGAAVRAEKRIWVLASVLLVSLGLDLTHLERLWLGQAPNAAQREKRDLADENFRAYQVLKDEARREGPGIIYTEFLLLSHGHSLATATYPFNAAENFSLDNGKAQWAAVIANVNYGPFLAKRFPKMRWIPVGTDLSSDGGLAVGIIPLAPDGHYLFNQWLEAHRYFHALNLQAEEILNRPDLYAAALGKLPEGEKWMGRDPFLESLFGERRAQYHYGAGGYEANEALLRETIQKGYPAAHLYFKLGNFLWLEGKKQAAKEAYAQAARQEPHLTQAAQALALLGSGK